MRQFVNLLLLLIVFTACQTTKEETTPATSEVITIGVKEKIYSEILGEEREVWVYVPPGFYGMNETNVRFPVVYITDGESQFIPTVGALEHLSSPASANDVIPRMMVVGITNINRDRDLTPTPGIMGTDSTTIHTTGGADKFAAFLREELIPFIEGKYPTVPHRTLVGHSLGGLFTFYNLLEQPELFANYLAIDPFLRWDEERFSGEVITALRQISFPGKRLYVATANNRLSWMSDAELVQDTNDITQMMRSNLSFKNTLTEDELGISYRNKYYENENHFQIPLLATYDAFRYFFSSHHFPEMMDYYHSRAAGKRDLVTKLQKHFSSLSAELGYKVLPSESYLNSWAFGFREFKRPDLALDLFNLNIDYFPESPNVYASKGYFLLSQQDTLAAITAFESAVSREAPPYVVSTLQELKGE